jgi:hypothetical protein
VVAERDRVGSGGEDALGELRGEAGALSGVLAIYDAEVGSVLLAERVQTFLERTPPGRAEDIRDEQNSYGMASVAAGCTSIATWLPASCV